MLVQTLFGPSLADTLTLSRRCWRISVNSGDLLGELKTREGRDLSLVGRPVEGR